jgi:hypothetical protein
MSDLWCIGSRVGFKLSGLDFGTGDRHKFQLVFGYSLIFDQHHPTVIAMMLNLFTVRYCICAIANTAISAT